MGKPAKSIKSANLRSLDGVRDIDFGKSHADARAAGDYSKDGSRMQPSPEFDDDKARMKRWGLGTY